MAVLCLAIVTGNGAVLVALKKARRAPSHYPLASLASADLLVGLFVLPLAAARELFVFHLNWAVCACWSTLDVLCCTASILSICVLGWERYRGITAPLDRARRTRQVKLYAALVWPVATAVALPTVFIPSPKHYLPGEIPKACDVNTNVGYVFFSIFFSFYMPACVMIVMYARILSALSTPLAIRAHGGNNAPSAKVESPKPAQKLSRSPRLFLKKTIQNARVFLSPKGQHLGFPGVSSARQTTPMKNYKSPGYMLSRRRRATRTIIMLMILFLLCWTPFFVMLPIDSICNCVNDVAWEWCTWLGYVNSALNPLVYAVSSPSVRQALHKTLSSNSTKTTDIQMTPNIKTVA